MEKFQVHLPIGPFLFFFFLNWDRVALQCCIALCYTMKQVSYKYTYIPALLDIPSPAPSHPSRSLQNTGVSSLCYTEASH